MILSQHSHFAGSLTPQKNLYRSWIMNGVAKVKQLCHLFNSGDLK